LAVNQDSIQLRIVTSGTGYSHSQFQPVIREKALMCGKKNSCVTSSQISVNISVLTGAGDGVSHLELLSIVLCSVSVFQNSSCCQTGLNGCIPTLFLESGNIHFCSEYEMTDKSTHLSSCDCLDSQGQHCHVLSMK